MKNLKIFLLLIVFTVSCNSSDTSDRLAGEQTEELQLASQRIVGMPNIHNFNEKKIMKLIMEMRDDEKLICHAYLSTYTGIHYLGRCIGYGLPYSTQYTNPMKRIYRSGHVSTLPQAEANGLFMPGGLSATWVILLDSANNPHVVYTEPNLIVSPVPLQIEGKKPSL